MFLRAQQVQIKTPPHGNRTVKRRRVAFIRVHLSPGGCGLLFTLPISQEQ